MSNREGGKKSTQRSEAITVRTTVPARKAYGKKKMGSWENQVNLEGGRAQKKRPLVLREDTKGREKKDGEPQKTFRGRAETGFK